MTPFVSLLFGLCAAYAGGGTLAPSSVTFGYEVHGACAPMAELTSEQRAVIEGHEVDWDPLDDGVLVHIDGRDFVLQHFAGA